MEKGITVKINVDGCEEAYTKVRACNGLCVSTVVTVNAPPFTEEHCTACRATKVHHNRPRTIRLTCNGELVEKTMYFPFIKECGCVNSTTSDLI
jgi:hypothetical protein